MRLLAILLLLGLGVSHAFASEGLYDRADGLRRAGRFKEARAAYEQLLAEKPDSGGALEGLALVCMRLGDYAAAAGYAELWTRLNPGSAYVWSLLADARERLGDVDGARAARREQVRLAPADLDGQRAWDRRARERGRGLFPEGRAYHSLVTEGLDTASPQRIVYQGSYAGAGLRLPMTSWLDATLGSGTRQEAQLNRTGDFTYYDLREDSASAGLAARPRRDLRLEAGYTYSSLRSLSAGSLGVSQFHSGRALAEWTQGDRRARVSWETSPKFVRGTGASTFFAVRREHAENAEVQGDAGPVTLKAGYGREDYSDGTGLDTGSASAARESGPHYLWAGWSRAFQEFYGADAATGKLQFVSYQRLAARYRFQIEDKVTFWAGAAQNQYADTNREWDAYGEAQAPLPRLKELSLRYRFQIRDFRLGGRGYDSVDERSHAAGPEWRHDWGHAFATMAGWEHAFVHDPARGSYRADAYYGELEWHVRTGFSLAMQGRTRRDTVDENGTRAGLQARWSF